MKKLCLLVLALLLLSASAQAWDFDLEPYMLRGRYIQEYAFLSGRDVVTLGWEDTNAMPPAHLTWWRDGEIHRDITLDAENDMRYTLIPRADGSCGVLKRQADGGRVPVPEGYSEWQTSRVVMYDWKMDGLQNERVIASGVSDLRAAQSGFGFGLIRLEGNSPFLSLYDDQGRLEADLPLPDGVNSLVKFPTRGDDGLWGVTVNKRMQDDYLFLAVQNGRRLNPEEYNKLAYSAFADGQGGYFVTARLSDNQYAPETICRYIAAGKRLWKKQLSGKNVVINAFPRIDPQTGHLILSGIASANSRGVKRAFCLEADEKGKTLRLDVRDCPAGEEYAFSVYTDPANGQIHLLIRHYDDYFAAWVPFEDLSQGENPGIKFK